MDLQTMLSSRVMRFALVRFLLLASCLVIIPMEASIEVISDFSGGSGEVTLLDSENQVVGLTPSLRESRGWPCWWYFRIEGAETGKPFSLRLSSNRRPFMEGRILPSSWSQPFRAAISTDNIQWQQTPKAKVTEDHTAIYSFPAPAPVFWVAWGPPFLPGHARDVLHELQGQIPESRIFPLARTRMNREVSGMEINPDSKDLPALWIQARQHAWEAGSSWVGKGFMDWLAGTSKDAEWLRTNVAITYIPIMDVDSVAVGAGGKDSRPRDHNRDWDQNPVYPEVKAAQDRIRPWLETGKPFAFIDLHNPGPGEGRPFFFGPFQYNNWDEEHKTRYELFLRKAIQHMTPPLAIQERYRITSYVKSQEELDRMSSNWIRNRGNEKTIAVTLETSWNTPNSTISGYESVGRKLGLAVTAYFRETLRED